MMFLLSWLCFDKAFYQVDDVLPSILITFYLEDDVFDKVFYHVDNCTIITKWIFEPNVYDERNQWIRYIDSTNIID